MSYAGTHYLTGEPVPTEIPTIDLDNNDSVLVFSEIVKDIRHCFYGDNPNRALQAIKVLGNNTLI